MVLESVVIAVEVLAATLVEGDPEKADSGTEAVMASLEKVLMTLLVVVVRVTVAR